MFEVPLGCPKFGLYADYKVNWIPCEKRITSIHWWWKLCGFEIRGLVHGPKKLLPYPVQWYCVVFRIFLKK